MVRMIALCNPGVIVAMKLSADARNSLYLVFGVGGLFAFVFFGMRYFPARDHSHPLWENLYFWSSSEPPGGYTFFSLFVMTANSVNNARGRPPRLWVESIAFVLGVGGILLAASLAAHDLPRVGVFDSLLCAILGGTCGRFLIEGAPAQVGRNLIAREIDYGGRFLPLLGMLLCLAFMTFVAWTTVLRWRAHDYTSVTDTACFLLGLVCVWIGGKRREKPAIAAAIA